MSPPPAEALGGAVGAIVGGLGKVAGIDVKAIAGGIKTALGGGLADKLVAAIATPVARLIESIVTKFTPKTGGAPFTAGTLLTTPKEFDDDDGGHTLWVTTDGKVKFATVPKAVKDQLDEFRKADTDNTFADKIKAAETLADKLNKLAEEVRKEAAGGPGSKAARGNVNAAIAKAKLDAATGKAKVTEDDICALRRAFAELWQIFFDAPSAPYKPPPPRRPDDAPDGKDDFDITRKIGGNSITITYTKGFPDFSGHLHDEKPIAHIKVTGHHKTDVVRANLKRGLPKPEGYTWHHHEDGDRMMLVKQSVHRKFPHIGSASAARYKERMTRKSSTGKPC